MRRLIIVEDEAEILKGMAELYPWENMGFEVAGTFLRAEDALSFLSEHAVDVVLTDISMPDMDGVALTQRLCAYPDIKVVFFSSYHDYHYMRAAIRNNVVDYLLKPVSYEDLVNCFTQIREMLDETNPVPEEQHPSSYYDEILRRVDTYMLENIRSCTLTAASELVGLSPNYLSTLYRKIAGVGFQDKLVSLRMEKARELLANPDFKSYEIAFHVGYDNPKNFARAFRSYYGLSPRDYRMGAAMNKDEQNK